MGIYLSTPNTDSNIECGSGAGLEFSVGEMQVSQLSVDGITDQEPYRLFFIFRDGERTWKMLTLRYQTWSMKHTLGKQSHSLVFLMDMEVRLSSLSTQI